MVKELQGGGDCFLSRRYFVGLLAIVVILAGTVIILDQDRSIAPSPVEAASEEADLGYLDELMEELPSSEEMAD